MSGPLVRLLTAILGMSACTRTSGENHTDAAEEAKAIPVLHAAYAAFNRGDIESSGEFLE